jgi:hypothetical protein
MRAADSALSARRLTPRLAPTSRIDRGGAGSMWRMISAQSATRARSCSAEAVLRSV